MFNQYGRFGGYQPQYPQMPPALLGRMVSSPDEIGVQEIPTDGSVGWFPFADGSKVYAKRMLPNGTVSTTVYAAESVPETVDPVTMMMGKLDEILALVGRGSDE